MKYIILFAILFNHNVSAIIKHYDNELEVINTIKIHKQMNQTKKANHLQEAKKLIFKGKYIKAKYLINLVSDHEEFYPIKIFYLALVQFLQKNYQASAKILQNKAVSNSDFYPNICLLKVLSFLATGNKKTNVEIKRCQKYTFHYSNNEQIWLNYLIDLNKSKLDLFDYAKNPKYIKYFLTNIEFTKILMKLSLYNGQYEKLLEQLPKIKQKHFQDEEFRELIAFTYYRLHNNQMAFKFLENINTPNAENIKGNIFLKSKKYEIALGHFQLALKYNPLSKNALYRVLPIAWKLQKYTLAISILEKIKLTKKNIDLYSYYLALLTKGKHLSKVVKSVNLNYKNYQPDELPMIIKYILSNLYFKMNNIQKTKIFSKILCFDGDINQCQLFKHLTFTKDYLKKLKRQQFKIEEYKVQIKKEVVYIDQADILEMDLKKINPMAFGNF